MLAHSLGALGLHIQAAQAVLTRQHDEAQAVELLGQARRLAADGLNETRRAVHALRGETRPLPDGLAELSADHQRRHGARVTFEVSGEPLSAAARCRPCPDPDRRPARQTRAPRRPPRHMRPGAPLPGPAIIG